MQWLKTGKSGATFNMIEMPDNSFVIGILGLQPSDPEWQRAVSNFQFRVSASGRVLLRRGAVKLNEAKGIFPGAAIADIGQDQIYIRRNKPNLSNRSVLPDTQASIFIGKNYLGQDVYSTATGARYINGRDGQPVSEETASLPPAFLRAIYPGDIDLCADGFVARMETEHLRANDLRAFCGSIYGEPSPVEATDSRLRDVQEAVEAAIFRRTTRVLHDTGDIKSSFQAAVRLAEHQPPMIFRTSTSVDLQQYSTPATLSVAAQYALGDVAGKSVLEPTIGNASLISAIVGAKVTGVEMDQARYTRTRMAVEQNRGLDAANTTLIHGDFTEAEFDKQFDAVICNPPFGGLAKPVVMDSLRVTRLDHRIMLQSLRHRRDDGRAVFIIGADHDAIFSGNEGKISGGSERLFAWLTDHYEVSAFEVDGDLYKKQGAALPVRVVAVGKKRPKEDAVRAKETKEFRIGRLPVVKSLDDLWSYAASMREFLDREDLSREQKQERAELKILDGQIAKAVEEVENPSFGNDFQSQYTPMSPGSTSAMIPMNMVVPQQVAFNRFLNDHPDPVEFVKNELRMDDLSGFEPEQIDAIAMGIWNMKRGRALILADQTGMGKGRIVAAIARWAALSEHQCNFLTEKAGLFSDLWRDVRDIGSESVFTPFILNADEKIVSLDGAEQEVLVQKTPNSVRSRLIEAGAPTIDDGYNLMLATYSQFNRPEVKSTKAGFIKNASRDAVVIMDESHNAAGDSNTGRNISEAVMMAKSALYSSATFAKNAKNMGVYYKAFPPSVNIASLADTLIAGGEPLQEVLSAMLCEDGVLVRREHDLSHLKFSTLDVPPVTLERNEKISDQMSDILSAMSFFSGDVEKIAKQLDKEIQEKLKNLPAEQRQGKRLGVSYMNFGSRLYSISRQFALVLATGQVAENAVRALQNGQKPVIVLEQTMESIMDEMSGDMTVDEIAEKGSGGQVRTEPLTIRLLATRLFDKIQYIVRTEDYGNTERVSVLAACRDAASVKAVKDYIKSIKEMIDALPDMPAMPLDQINHKLSQSGYTCGEVSGRGTTYVFNDDGSVTPEKNMREKNAEIFKFNSGEYDAMILTRSGCTGVSLHASEKFADRRQRVMIEAQIAQNVNERVQFFGRVNRRGQVSSPEIWSVTSGLPWENRSLAMQNMKLRKLSANTQSNRNNAAEMKDIPDILNPIGNEVCKAYLLNNPEIMTLLSIDPDYEGDRSSEDGCYFANKLTGRLSLLHVKEQRRIYSEITDEYRKTLDDLSHKGINPLESRVLDVKAEVEERKLLVAGQNTGSVFDAPVYAEKIVWTEDIEPLRSVEVIRRVNDSIGKMVEDGRFKINNCALRDLPYELRERARNSLPIIDISGCLELARAGFRDAMFRAVPSRFENRDDPDAAVADALTDKDVNAVQRLDSRMKWLSDNIQHLMPGSPIRFTTGEGEEDGVILSVSPPGAGKEHYLGSWEIKVLPVGRQKPVSMTYNTLIDDSGFTANPYDYSSIYGDLDTAPSGKLRFSKWTLSGNLFRAAELAAKSKMGRTGIYTDTKGCRHRAILCNAAVNLSDLFTMEVSLSEADAREEIQSIISSKPSGEIDFGDDFMLRWSDGGNRMRLITPGSKSSGGRVFLDNDLRAFTGDFSGSRQTMSAEFNRPKDMDAFVGALYKAGLSIKKRVDSNVETDIVERAVATRRHQKK